MSKLPDPDIFRTVTATVEFILVFVSFLSNWFADSAVFTNVVTSMDFDENQPLLTMLSTGASTQHRLVSKDDDQYCNIEHRKTLSTI